jgi:tRNA 2-selenouridine synthase
MPLEVKEFLKKAEQFPLVDVRTPAEYEQGHIPGAHNIPLFSNEERAEVGTLYKQEGKEEAVMKGLEFVGPKMHGFAKKAKELSVQSGGKILVHCWRGGMRSQSMAWLFNTAGMQADTLFGGYKAYRAYNRALFERDIPIVILGGKTGSGKTHILEAIKQRGEQVIDLEGIAHHKGSAFGHIGEAPQPSTEQFENDLAAKWQELDFNQVLWLEDESKSIGRVYQPDIVYQKIRSAPLLFVEVPLEQRVEMLVKDYTVEDKEALALSLNKIVKRLGGDNYKMAMEALEDGDFATTARIALRYYDKAYLYGMSKREPKKVHRVDLPYTSFEDAADELIKQANEFYSI